jgi:hypothetical protein
MKSHSFLYADFEIANRVLLWYSFLYADCLTSLKIEKNNYKASKIVKFGIQQVFNI